jgi:hypothetical protein
VRTCWPAASADPTATANFPDAWLSHYIPSPTKTPLVFAVDIFYKLFIPATLGGMVVLVALDASWQIRKRVKRNPETEGPGAGSVEGPATRSVEGPDDE